MKENSTMTIYVLIPMEEGIVRDVQVFLTKQTAAQAEQAWLKVQDIHTEKEREHKSDWGTGVAIWECEIQG